MNFKILSKQFFMYTIFFLISSILFFIFRIQKLSNPSIPTMAIPKESKIIKHDLNGDGIKDLIYILVKDTKYHIEISINDKTYFLNEKKPLNTLGTYNSIAPLKLSFFDISRNNLSEIFIQSFDNNTPIQHIYTFDNNEFKDIFCSTNNTFGVLNSKNNQSPKYFSLDLNNPNETLQKYMLINSTPKNISYDDIQIPGLSTVQLLIKYILTNESLGNVFFENTSDTITRNLDLIDKVKNKYVLLDSFFKDIAWDLSNDITKIDWNIRIAEVNLKTNESSILKLSLKLEKIDDKFLISDLILKKDL